MLFTDNDFRRIFENRETEPWKSQIEMLAGECSLYLDNPFPESDRTRHNWTLERARDLLEITVKLGVYYKLTNDDKYARRAVEFLLDSAGWELWFYKTGVDDNSPFDLGTGETAMAFAVVLPLVRGAMSDSEHIKCLEVMDRRVLTPFLEVTGPEDIKAWWHHGLNNWNCVCNGGQLAASVYMRGCGYEAERADLAIGRALEGMGVYFDAMHEDGSCEEGIAYWGYATKYFIMALLYWENATGGRHPFFDTIKCARWLRFPFDFSSGNAALSFGDCNYVFSCEMAYAYAARVGDTEILEETAKRLGNEKSVWSLMFTRGSDGRPRKTGRGLVWYPDNGWAAFKTDGLVLSFRSGSTNVSHAMKDMHSVQLSRNGEQLLQNMENHPYTVGWFGKSRDLYWENNTGAKNSPLFNGIGQIRLAAATFGLEGDRVVSECSCVYPDFMERVWRAVGFGCGCFFEIEDEFIAKQELCHELRFMSPGRFERISDREARVTNNGQEAALRFICDVDIDIWAGETFYSIPNNPAVGILRVYTEKMVMATRWKTVIL